MAEGGEGHDAGLSLLRHDIAVDTISSARPRAASIAGFADRVSPAFLLAGIVALSFLAELVLALRLPAPFIFRDELVYEHLSRSFAAGELPAIRGATSFDYGVLYPLLIAPPFALFENLTQAFIAVKVINAAVASLAAVPTFFLARRVVSTRLALVVAALAVAVPSMVLTANAMTENAFYPLFLLTALAAVRMLEQPTPARQLVAVFCIALASAVRIQAVVLLLAVAVAAAVWIRIERHHGRFARTTSFRTLAALLAAVASAALLAPLAAGRDPTSVLGAYRVLVDLPDLGRSVWFVVLHLATLDVYLAVFGLVGAILGAQVALRRSSQRSARATAVVAVVFTVALTLQVSLFSATEYGAGRTHERNLYYAVPLLLVLVGLWLESGSRAKLSLLIPLLVAAAILPAFLPWKKLINASWVDNIAIQAFDTHLLDPTYWRLWLLSFGVLGALAVPLRRVEPRLLVLLLAAWLVVTSNAAWRASDATSQAVARPRTSVDWVDEAVGRDQRVALLYFDASHCLEILAVERLWVSFWETEFFNRSVTEVLYVGGPLPDGLPASRVLAGANGALQFPRAANVRYVVVDSELQVSGQRVATDRQTRLSLWRLSGPLRLAKPTTLGEAIQRLCATPRVGGRKEVFAAQQRPRSGINRGSGSAE